MTRGSEVEDGVSMETRIHSSLMHICNMHVPMRILLLKHTEKISAAMIAGVGALIGTCEGMT